MTRQQQQTDYSKEQNRRNNFIQGNDALSGVGVGSFWAFPTISPGSWPSLRNGLPGSSGNYLSRELVGIAQLSLSGVGELSERYLLRVYLFRDWDSNEQSSRSSGPSPTISPGSCWPPSNYLSRELAHLTNNPSREFKKRISNYLSREFPSDAHLQFLLSLTGPSLVSSILLFWVNIC